MKRRPRGSGTIRKVGSGWAIIHGTRTAPLYEGGFRTKTEAERRLTVLRSEAMHRKLGIAADPRLTPPLGELAGPWLQRRKATHKAAAEDEWRWKKHLAPYFGHLRPDDVDHARLRAFAEAKLAEGLASGTVRILVAILSSLYVDLVERGLARANPARGLPSSLARMLRPSHDPRTTPFLEKLTDSRRVFLKLPEPLHIAFALGAYGGLRPGEAFALKWAQVDLEARRIHVVESVTGTTKDKDSRVVPILDALLPILKAWHLKTGGSGLLCPPLRCDGKKVDKGTRSAALREALHDLELEREGLGWYECTRHTFASQWVMGGGSIEQLKEVLGHYSVVMTERYAHLKPDLFAASVYGALGAPVDAKPGSVADINVHSADRVAPSNRYD